jgi:hypothetical protein
MLMRIVSAMSVPRRRKKISFVLSKQCLKLVNLAHRNCTRLNASWQERKFNRAFLNHYLPLASVDLSPAWLRRPLVASSALNAGGRPEN